MNQNFNDSVKQVAGRDIINNYASPEIYATETIIEHCVIHRIVAEKARNILDWHYSIVARNILLGLAFVEFILWGAYYIPYLSDAMGFYSITITLMAACVMQMKYVKVWRVWDKQYDKAVEIISWCESELKSREEVAEARQKLHAQKQ